MTGALDFVEFSTMTQLQERVAKLGCCPRCHRKTLLNKHEDVGMRFSQCSECLHVYVTSSDDPEGVVKA